MYSATHTNTAGDEIHRLQKMVNDLSYELSQLQTQLDTAQRDKLMEQNKGLELERMHLQMKESVAAEIDYLRKLNLQFVEQKMKGCYDQHTSTVCMCVMRSVNLCASMRNFLIEVYK